MIPQMGLPCPGAQVCPFLGLPGAGRRRIVGAQITPRARTSAAAPRAKRLAVIPDTHARNGGGVARGPFFLPTTHPRIPQK